MLKTRFHQLFIPITIFHYHAFAWFGQKNRNDRSVEERLKDTNQKTFTIRDLRGYYEYILKWGSLLSFIYLFPGIWTHLIDTDNQKESIKRTRRYICIMDSMTAHQLDCVSTLYEEGRLKRIARGSGTRIEDVRILLQEHRRIRGHLLRVAPTNRCDSFNSTRNLINNSKQNLDRLYSMIGPKMLAQIGGPGNLMKMMKEMSNNPDTVKTMEAVIRK